MERRAAEEGGVRTRLMGLAEDREDGRGNKDPQGVAPGNAGISQGSKAEGGAGESMWTRQGRRSEAHRPYL